MRALTDLVVRHTVALRRTGPYRPPDESLLAGLPALLDDLAVARDPARSADALGLRGATLDGRVVLHPPEPGGGPWVVIAAAGTVPSVLVEVPHPQADLDTEHVALAVLASVPSALLLMAGAHRVAAAPPDATDRDACPADVAVRSDTLFSRVADGLVARTGCPQVQVHGFGDRRARGDLDVVVSPGAAPSGLLVARVRRALTAAGLRTCGPDDPGCADLAGRRNVQGLAARRHGAPFLHLELSRGVRADPELRALIATAVAASL